jgi:hypothetical protein
MVVVGGSRRRAPGILIRSPPRTPEPETESEASVDSEPGDPSYTEQLWLGPLNLRVLLLAHKKLHRSGMGGGSVRMWAAKMSLTRSLGGFERRRKSTLRILRLVLGLSGWTIP